MMNFPAFEGLAGKRLLVVGGSSGIGQAVAAMAAAHGASVTIVGRDAARLAEAAASIGGEGSALDMLDESAVEGFFAGNAPFDHVVITAAQLRSGPIRDLSLADARATFDSKFWGSYLVARHAKIVDGGSLTLTSGAGGRRPRAGRAAVAAATVAVETLTRVLASEFVPVRVNCVSPGLVDTPLLRSVRPASSPPPPQPVARVARPEEIGFQILACALNPFMTGAIVDVDGGLALT